jgi:hypothetical protein
MTEDELDRSLRALAPVDLPPALAQRVLVEARAVFYGARDASAWAGRVRAVAMATAVISAITLYLTWCVEFVNALASG